MNRPLSYALAAAHLTAGLYLAHAATITVNHGGAPATATALYATAALAAAAALTAAPGPRRPPVPTRPGTADEDAAALATLTCDQDRGENPFAWTATTPEGTP